MNILQLVPRLDVGGVEKGTVEVARYLTSHGHKAVVVSSGGKMVRKLAAIGARHYELPVGSKNPFRAVINFFQLRGIIIRENIDIVHARSRVPALVGYFAARSTGRIFLTTAHGQYRKHLISRVMGWGKLVIAVSVLMARHMHDNFGVPLRKIRIVPRGVDLEEFSYIAPSERKGPSFTVGMIARFTPLKGHLDFLKAASFVLRRVPNAEFVLMGNKATAKPEYMKKIELAIRQYSLGQKLRFIPSESDVAEVMSNLHVLVSANRSQEAFGRTVIEAQARGTCVVATEVGGVVENVRDNETGLLCRPADPEDMADKIVKYAWDRELMDTIAANARRKVENELALPKVMRKTMGVYEEALNTRNILIIKISSIGDVVLGVPSLRAVRERYGAARIKLLVDVRFRDLFVDCPYIDEIISCDLKRRDRGMGFLRLAERLRSEDFDISIDLQNSRRSHMLAFLAGIPQRYGYDNGKFGFLLNRKITPPRSRMGPVRHQAQVLQLAGVTRVDERLELWPSEEALLWVNEFLDAAWLQKDQELIAFNLSASEKWTSKNWPLKHVEKLLSRLESERSARVVLLGTQHARVAAEELLRSGRIKPIDCVGRTDLKRLVAVISRCDALVTPDSAPLHIAAACGVPAVAIFGPTDPARHLPPGKGLKALRSRSRCVGCYKAVCPKDNRCMKAVKPDEVFAALDKLIKESGEK